VIPDDQRSEIDRPLGRDVVRAARTRRMPAFADVMLGLCAIALVVGSGAIALRDRPFRAPQQPVVLKPEEAASLDVKQAEVPPPAAARPSSGGPSIIKVSPPAGGQGGIVVHDPSAASQNPLTAHLPDRALVEESEYGLLPVRAADGRRPFDVYARPWSGARGARVAIVLGGLAVSQTGTQAAIERLPGEITLAFASGGNSIDRWMQDARRRGHEILMQVPLEPFDYPSVDPGRNTLTVDASPQENLKRLHWALGRTTNYTGVLNYMGARFVADKAAMSTLIGDLADRGLMYLDDGSSARSEGEELAKSLRAPFAAADIAIDQERDKAAILAKLDDLERTARAKGTAIGIGSAFDATVQAVTEWAAEAKKRGIEIVPVSALAFDPEAR
jgi:polysaccharide deacetylase 2 family uncharacterized protein YibQ